MPVAESAQGKGILATISATLVHCRPETTLSSETRLKKENPGQHRGVNQVQGQGWDIGWGPGICIMNK